MNVVDSLAKMQIYFWLDWYRPGKRLSQEFKNEHALGLFEDYIERIRKFVPVEIGAEPRKLTLGGAGNVVVLYADVSSSAKDLMSSEDLASWIEGCWQSGVSQIVIAVGGADGWGGGAAAGGAGSKKWRPQDRKWSFGPMTLPHELAAAVCSEQVYRALSILKKFPYHFSH